MTGGGSSGTDTNLGAKSKRFKDWFKLKKKPFRTKHSSSADSDTPHPADELPTSAVGARLAGADADADAPLSDVVYYNFCAVPTSGDVRDVHDAEDDVFSDTSTIRGEAAGSTRTLSRRRHSIGSWFRTSLAAVRKNASASTASGLEAPVQRPSTSSERALLARTVSTSANCVSYR